MHSFSRAITNTIVYLLIVVLIALLLPISYLHYCENNWTSRSDMYIRNRYAGSVNTLFLSYSHGLNAFIPETYDEYVEGESYNGCSSLATIRGRYALLEQELQRNPIDTVVLELSYNIMSSEPYRVEGDSLVMQKISGWQNRLKFWAGGISLDNAPMSYYYLVHCALSMITDRLSYDVDSETLKALSDRGYERKESVDLLQYADAQQYIDSHDAISENINSVNEEYLRKIIELCKNNDVDIVLVTVPVSNLLLDYYTNEDYFNNYYNDIAIEYGIDYIDMCKVDGLELDDYCDFSDTEHLAASGADKVTRMLGEIMQCREDTGVVTY